MKADDGGTEVDGDLDEFHRAEEWRKSNMPSNLFPQSIKAFLQQKAGIAQCQLTKEICYKPISGK